MKILDWLANLIFGKLQIYDAETDKPITKISIRRRNNNTDDPYGLNG